MKPSLYWRNALRSAMPRAPTDEDLFLEYCVQIHASETQVLEEMLSRGASDTEIRGARMAVYIVALALLTYGRLDVIGDVLENVLPYPHPTNRGLASAVNSLIPLPSEMHAGISAREALAWIRTHASALQWDENAGRFILIGTSIS